MDTFSHRVGGSRILRVALSILAVLLLSGSLRAAGPITEFPIPTSNSSPAGITAGPDGNLWFCEYLGRKIGRVTPPGAITEFPTTGPPVAITAGPDGNVWFAEADLDDVIGSGIGRVSPSGEVHEFFLSTPACGIVAGLDGNLWFASCNSNAIGRMTTDGAVTMFSLPSGSGHFPSSIAAGPDGNLWYTVPITRQIGRITLAGEVAELPLPPGPGRTPNSIVAGPGGLWFTDGDKIGRITTGGEVTEFDVPASALAVDSNGNLWFGNSDTIGRLSIVGDHVDIKADFATPTANAGIFYMTAGPDGSLWFTESNGNNVGRLDISPCSPNSLCLGDRFQVTTAWEGGGRSGTGTPVPVTANAGYFWFFEPANVEVFVKILDVCRSTGKFNVYVNGLTHLGVTITVTDVQTGTSKAFVNPEGAPFSLLFDGSTFACP